MSIDHIYNLPDKISVPKSLALAELPLKPKLVGKRPISALYQTLQTLDGELYDVLKDEIDSQLPPEAQQMLKDHQESEHKAMMEEKMTEMSDSMEKMCQMMEDKEEHIEMMMPEELRVSNLSEIKIPKVEIPKFPKIDIPKYDDSKVLAKLESVRTAVIEKDYPTPLDTVAVSNLKDVPLTDIEPVVKAVEAQTKLFDTRLTAIEESLDSPKKTYVLDKKGNIVNKFGGDAVAIGGGGGGGGYSGIKDGNTFITDSDYDLPIGGLYEASPTSLTSGDQGVVGLSVKRAMRTTLELADGTPVTTFGGHEYQEDQAHTSGDYGIQTLAVRKDTAVALGANGDYAPQELNARGATWVAIEDGAGGQITSFGGGTEYADGAARGTATGGLMMGDDGTSIQSVHVDTAGDLQVDVLTLPAVLQGTSPWVISGAVTNAGTFVVQENGAALTSLQLIDDTVFTDDTSTHATGTTKVLGIGAVADPTDAAVNANDIGMPAMTTTRFLKVIPQANSGVDIGDVDVLTMPGTGVEDAAETAGGTLLMAGSVRRDTAASSAGTTGDNATINTDSVGALWSRSTGELADDAAFTVGTSRVMPAGLLVDDTSTDAADEGDVVIGRATPKRVQYFTRPSGTGTTGTLDLASASTAYRITTSSTLVHNFKFRSRHSNSGVVTWGYSSTYANNLQELLPNLDEGFDYIDISLIYFGSTNAGDDLIYSYDTP